MCAFARHHEQALQILAAQRGRKQHAKGENTHLRDGTHNYTENRGWESEQRTVSGRDTSKGIPTNNSREHGSVAAEKRG